MKVLKNLSLMVLLALAFAGCRGKSSQLADFNKQLYAPEYASGFKIERADGRQSVLVSVMNPWQGADSVTTRLFISRNGEPVPEGFDGQVLEGDAQRIVAMSSTHIAMLDAIGETARVVAFRDSTISPIPTFRHAATASATWVTREISIMNFCCRSTLTLCCFSA